MVQATQQTLSVKEAIQSRHSIRNYTQETIPQDDMNRIFELVRLSPSAWNLQPWRFIVVTDPKLKEKLKNAAYDQEQVTSAPAVVIVASDMEDTLKSLSETVHPGVSEERKQQEVQFLSDHFEAMSIEERGNWALAQTNIALGFLLLAIQSIGYSSVPMLGFDQEKVKEIVGLAQHVKIAAMVPFGHADEEGYPHHRFDLNKIVKYQ